MEQNHLPPCFFYLIVEVVLNFASEKWELKEKVRKVEQVMWVVSFSCLTGLQNLERNYSLASQIYQVQFYCMLHRVVTGVHYSIYIILLFHRWLLQIFIFFIFINFCLYSECSKQGKKGYGNFPMTRHHLVGIQFFIVLLLLTCLDHFDGGG